MKKKSTPAAAPGDPGDGSIGNPGDGVPDRPNASQRDEERQINDILAKLRTEELAGGVVTIKRRAIGETQFGYLTELPVENFTLEIVKTTFGGGDYQAKAQTGRRQYVGGFNFKIDYAIPSKYPGTEKKTDTPAPPAAPPPGNDLPALIRELKEAVKPAPVAAADNSVLIEFMRAQAVQTSELLKAMVTNRGGGGSDLLLQRLTALEQKLDQPQRRSSVSELREMFEVVEMMRGGDEDKDKPSKLESFFEKAAMALAPAIAAHLGGAAPRPLAPPAGVVPDRSAAPPSTPARTVPAGAGVTVDVPAGSAQPQDMSSAMGFAMQQVINNVRPAVLDGVAQKIAPADLAISLLSWVPEIYFDRIEQMLSAPTWFADMFGEDPEIKAIEGYVNQVRAALLEEIKQDGGTVIDMPPAGSPPAAPRKTKP